MAVDLREATKIGCERKRYLDHKAKWSYGIRPLYGETELRDDGHYRPGETVWLPRKRGWLCYTPYKDEIAYSHELATRANNHSEINEALQERHEGENEDGTGNVDAPRELDTSDEVFYSVDDQNAPSNGEHTLRAALDCAATSKPKPPKRRHSK